MKDGHPGKFVNFEVLQTCRKNCSLEFHVFVFCGLGAAGATKSDPPRNTTLERRSQTSKNVFEGGTASSISRRSFPGRGCRPPEQACPEAVFGAIGHQEARRLLQRRLAPGGPSRGHLGRLEALPQAVWGARRPKTSVLRRVQAAPGGPAASQVSTPPCHLQNRNAAKADCTTFV